MEEINIWWEGPFTQEEIIKNKINSKKYDNRATDIGLYQVYSSHPLYGADVLVYIGMTVAEGGFKSRLTNRWVIENGNDIENVKIYLGRIHSYSKKIDKEVEEKDYIKKAEALLINALTPAFNSSYIKGAGIYVRDDYQVNNMNNYRKLYPQLSSRYYWKDEDINFTITDELAEKYNLNAKEDKEEEYYGFDINDNIFFGIDYKCWNNINIPLVIGVSKTSVNKEDLGKLSKIIWKDEDLYYISAIDDLKTENAFIEIEEKIKQLRKIIL